MQGNSGNSSLQVCPVCADASPRHARARVTLVYGTEYDLAECPGCGTLYFDPLPTPEQLAEFYSAGYYNFDRAKGEGKGMAFARRLRRWRRRGRLLDIGCATGFFINGIRNHSEWEVYGTDFGAAAVRYARDTLGLDVRQGELAAAGFPDAWFDYIHLNNVLEHVPDPVALLAECRRLLKPDGLFYLSVPNGYNDSFEIIEFHRREALPARSPNGHIYFFPAATLRRLLVEAGFEVLQAKSYGFRRGLRNIGVLPRKRHWKRAFQPPAAPAAKGDGEVHVASLSRRPNFYYHYRFWESNVAMVPGLHRGALDFMFLLRRLS